MHVRCWTCAAGLSSAGGSLPLLHLCLAVSVPSVMCMGGGEPGAQITSRLCTTRPIHDGLLGSRLDQGGPLS